MAISLFGGSPFARINTPADDLLEEEFFTEFPDAALQNVFPNASRLSPLADFLRNSLGRMQSQFRSTSFSNPNQTFRDFLRSQDLEGQFRNLAPQQRGENWISPMTRWVGRRYGP